MFTIKELSRRTGLKPTTIRYYETMGLITRLSRAAGDAPLFDETAEKRLVFVTHARRLGFSLAHAQLFVEILGSASPGDAERDQTLAACRRDVDERIRLLERFRDFLAPGGPRDTVLDDVMALAEVEPEPPASTPSYRRSWLAMRRRRFATP